MTTVFDGQTLFIYQMHKTSGGFRPESLEGQSNTEAIIKACGLAGAWPKIADGALPFNRGFATGKTKDTYYGPDNVLPAFFDAQTKAGRKRIGWQYLYGNNPIAEAEMAAEQITKYRLEGYVADPETEYKVSGKSVAARQFMRRLRSLCPNTPIALCTFRFPSYHKEFPWTAFLDEMDESKGDVHMPQVYWVGDYRPVGPAEQNIRSMKELKAIKNLPFIPVGSSYGAPVGIKYWYPTAEQMVNFSESAKDAGCTGISWWAWDTISDKDATTPTMDGKHGWWKAIINEANRWPVIVRPDEPVEISDSEKLIRLWAAHPELH